jgi:uracil-DNA glycosylase
MPQASAAADRRDVQPSKLLACREQACIDVDRRRFAVSSGALDPDAVQMILVAEATPADPALAAETTVAAFRAAGADVSSLADVEALGVYLTTAVKCGKRGSSISRETIRACAPLLDVELALFPFAHSLLLMGDVAIKALNAIAALHGEPRVIPAGATYRLRGGDYRFRGMRVFPSYLQAGPAWFIEAGKRRMIAEDIAAALAITYRASRRRPAG